jgi:sulfate permease, SulP family
MQKIKSILYQYVPILNWLPSYNSNYFKGDLVAGITIGVLLIPQGMAYALLAGLEPIHGLYAVTIPLILYAIFGTSRQLSVGPGAMIALLTATSISQLIPQSVGEYLQIAVTLAFLVGLIQLVFGLFRFGFIINFLSNPVISGYTSAAAIVIGISQLNYIFGLPSSSSKGHFGKLIDLFHSIDSFHVVTGLIGVGALLFIYFGKKIRTKTPITLVVLFIGILLTWSFDLASAGVPIIGDIPSGLPKPTLPFFNDYARLTQLLPYALTIALIGFAESSVIAKTIQTKHTDYKISSNQELIGLGMANLGASIVQAFPVTGGLSRSAVNDQSGAKTGMASIISSVIIILTLLFFTPLFYHLPYAILAAIILVAVLSLIDLKTIRSLWKNDKLDFLMLLSTFVLTLFFGIEIGIVTGMLLSISAVVYRASIPHIVVLGKVPGTDYYKNSHRFPELELRKDVLMIRIDGPIYFANVDYIYNHIEANVSIKGGDLNTVILNIESVTSIDSTGINHLTNWLVQLQKQKLTILITGAKGPIRDSLNQWGIVHLLGDNCLFSNDTTAIDYLDRKISTDALNSTKKYNN